MSTTLTASTVERELTRVVALPAAAPGFIGDGHTAVHVIDARDFAVNDPFILLADDRIDLAPGGRAGGPHPHAGFEIATFVVAGELRDRDEGVLRAGDVAFMTAGSGVIHGEDVEPHGPARILQLWVTSPSASRWVEPRFEYLTRDAAPVRRLKGVEARVYSGASGSLKMPSRTNLPLTMVDIRLEPHAVFEQALPASYAGFLYPLEGAIFAGAARKQRLAVGQVGWLEPVEGADATNVRLVTGERGARVMLYAGERQDVPIVTHGPFVGETRADLVRVSQAYVDGRMPRLSDLAAATS